MTEIMNRNSVSWKRYLNQVCFHSLNHIHCSYELILKGGTLTYSQLWAENVTIYMYSHILYS